MGTTGLQLHKLQPAFLSYLATEDIAPGDQLPNLSDISDELGVSVGKLREQLEHARRLGLISSRPRVGTRREHFDFGQAILPIVLFGLATEEASFTQFSELRRFLEVGLWRQAVSLLTPHDKAHLFRLVDAAWKKLREEPVHVPRVEHRDFHITIFRHIDNPFVQGILEAYWEAYEASELTRIADYGYWLSVWEYHQKIADAIHSGDIEAGLALLLEHFELLPSVSRLGDGHAIRSGQRAEGHGSG
jgi:DNA-binding FadR family transcriptional regulator